MKRIIVLERIFDPELKFKYALWTEVPAGNEAYFASPNNVSAYKSISPQEQLDLTEGRVTERVGTYQTPKNTPLPTIANDLKALWTSFENEITNYNPTAKYGFNWDGTTWSQG
jgi:hypothetical protein